MEWIEDPITAAHILDDIKREVRGKPKPLPHVTELIYCLTRSYYNRFRPLPPTVAETTIFAVGIGLERVLLRPHKQNIAGEIEGIHFEADFIEYGKLVGELKSTRLSAKKEPSEFPQTWLKQTLSYAYALSRYLKVPIEEAAILAVLHLMGNYAPPFPTLKVWKLLFSQEEVIDNWKWLLGRKEVYLAHIAENKVPQQFQFNEKWECEHCPYKILCDANQMLEGIERREELPLPVSGE